MPAERLVGFILQAGGLSSQLTVHAEPVAVIAPLADLTPQVMLAAIIKGHDIGIGDEGRRVFVFDLHRGAWKDEAVVVRGSGIVKARVSAIAAKCADADQIRFEHHGVAERRLPARHQSILFLFSQRCPYISSHSPSGSPGRGSEPRRRTLPSRSSTCISSAQE